MLGNNAATGGTMELGKTRWSFRERRAVSGSRLKKLRVGGGGVCSSEDEGRGASGRVSSAGGEGSIHRFGLGRGGGALLGLGNGHVEI